MFNFLARLVIKGYQKFISPYKGYGCAHRVHGGSKTGCSGYAMRLLNKHSLIKSMLIMRRRFDRCAWYAQKARVQVQEQVEAMQINQYRVAHSQRGECDCGAVDCSAVDCPSFDCGDMHIGQSCKHHCSVGDMFDFCSWGPDCTCPDSNSNSRSERAAAREEKRRQKRQEQAAQHRNEQDGIDYPDDNNEA